MMVTTNPPPSSQGVSRPPAAPVIKPVGPVNPNLHPAQFGSNPIGGSMPVGGNQSL